jgi:hypothetical protein
MVPIAILAALGAKALPAQAARFLALIGLGLFGLDPAVIWAAWTTMMLKGVPPDAKNLICWLR